MMQTTPAASSPPIWRRLEVLLLLVATSAYTAWFALPILWSGADNARMVLAFYIDEHISLAAIQQSLEQNTLLLQHRSYGHIFLNTALLPLFVLNQFTEVTAQQMTVTLRLISTLAGIGTIGATFLLARRYFGSPIAWGAAMLLAVLPLSFLRYATLARADIMQAWFLVLAIYFCCRFAEQGREHWLTWASLAAGFAFAAKYSGLFVLPVFWLVISARVLTNQTKTQTDTQTDAQIGTFITRSRGVLAALTVLALASAVLFSPTFVAQYMTVDGTIEFGGDLVILQQLRIAAALLGTLVLLIVALPHPWRWLQRTTWLNDPLHQIVPQIVRTLIVFGLAFVVTAPASLWQFDFVRAFVFQSRNKTFGLYFADDRGGLYWINLLASQYLLSWLLVGLIGLCCIGLLVMLIRLRWQLLLHPLGIIGCWAAIHMLLLVGAIRYFVPHFVLPALPFLIILALYPIHWLAQSIAARYSPHYGQAAAIGLVALLLSIELPGALPQVHQYRQQQSNKHASALVQVGEWLEQHYPSSTSITYDLHTYVPPAFTNAERFRNDMDLRTTDTPPDVVVVNQSIADMYRNIEDASNFFEEEERFLNIHAYYQTLREEQLGYTLVYEAGIFKVYERQ